MGWPITITKFVGTISLGLLTVSTNQYFFAFLQIIKPGPFIKLQINSNLNLQGISYNISTITLPSLALLPTASSASRTLAQIQTATTRHVLTFASISSVCLITCYSLASARGKHPYLLWTALMAFLGGQGVEYYYNGLARFPKLRSANNGSKSYVMVEDEDEGSVNGEKVEMEMSRERRVQGVRALVSGVGFAMGVVGIWGDGA